MDCPVKKRHLFGQSVTSKLVLLSFSLGKLMRGIGSSGRKLGLRSVGSVQLSGTVHVKGGLAGRAEGLDWLFLILVSFQNVSI